MILKTYQASWRQQKNSLKTGKIELVLFTSKKQLYSELKIKLNGKKLYETGSAKFWEIPADKNLNWKQQVNHMATKLKKTNAMLSKLRYFLESKTRKSVYYASFESHLCYTFLFWAQNSNLVKRRHLLQEKSLRLCFFRVEILIQVLYWETSKLLSPLIKLLLKTTSY